MTPANEGPDAAADAVDLLKRRLVYKFGHRADPRVDLRWDRGITFKVRLEAGGGMCALQAATAALKSVALTLRRACVSPPGADVEVRFVDGGYLVRGDVGEPRNGWRSVADGLRAELAKVGGPSAGQSA